MSDKEMIYPPTFFGIGMNIDDYSIIDVMKWLAVVGIFYVIISCVNGHYKEQTYNGQIIRYGSYRRWLRRYLISISLFCFLISMCVYIIFAFDYDLLLCFFTMLNMTVNFIFKAVCLFWISNRKNYNVWIGIFLVFEVISVYRSKWSHVNPFAWSMACRADMMVSKGFDTYIVITIELIVIFAFLFCHNISR